MNIAVIFAGGLGKRMNAKATPKQFLEVHGKPIIIYTLEQFETHPEIDGIVIACHPDWIRYLEEKIYKFRVEKVWGITAGGSTGQESIYNGLCLAKEKAGEDEDAIVLIHDGVRPLINADLISANIASVKEFGSAITSTRATETFAITDTELTVEKIMDRNVSQIAKAPQSFYLKDILSVHEQAKADGVTDAIDSCTLMHRYGKRMRIVEGPYTNIKITTQEDFYMFRALQEARENMQLN
ncbi:MAG: 2-C-methyl-D-erythritol 4-phosphate cytidylyltransferase [Lachnospiraceae bacterium]|nr:2-C-methyl-D-erythritol 4-phosphate cytidylyltransferase [Lachnospiraceae bacterium]